MAGAAPQSALVEQQLIAASKIIEESIDNELARLDNLEEDDLESIRRERIAAMKKRAKKKTEWAASGHGEYSEFAEEKEFFEASKKSENLVVHFYRDSFERCKIVDKHLNILAKKHMETRFCKINVEKAPFLTERLGIRVLPTMALIKDGKTKDYIIGFSDLGNCDDFKTEVLEWRIGAADVLEYNGDLMQPPKMGPKRHNVQVHKKTIRGRTKNDSETDSD